jgi:hypothetical protein
MVSLLLVPVPVTFVKFKLTEPPTELVVNLNHTELLIPKQRPVKLPSAVAPTLLPVTGVLGHKLVADEHKSDPWP